MESKCCNQGQILIGAITLVWRVYFFKMLGIVYVPLTLMKLKRVLQDSEREQFLLIRYNIGNKQTCSSTIIQVTRYLKITDVIFLNAHNSMIFGKKKQNLLTVIFQHKLWSSSHDVNFSFFVLMEVIVGDNLVNSTLLLLTVIQNVIPFLQKIRHETRGFF